MLVEPAIVRRTSVLTPIQTPSLFPEVRLRQPHEPLSSFPLQRAATDIRISEPVSHISIGGACRDGGEREVVVIMAHQGCMAGQASMLKSCGEVAESVPIFQAGRRQDARSQFFPVHALFDPEAEVGVPLTVLQAT